MCVDDADVGFVDVFPPPLPLLLTVLVSMFSEAAAAAISATWIFSMLSYSMISLPKLLRCETILERSRIVEFGGAIVVVVIVAFVVIISCCGVRLFLVCGLSLFRFDELLETLDSEVNVDEDELFDFDC